MDAALPLEFPTAMEMITEIVRRGPKTGLVRDGKPLTLAIFCHGIILRVTRARAFGELEAQISKYVGQTVAAYWRVLAGDRVVL